MVFPVVGGDGKPTGYDIDNSLRFNTADDAFMQRTFTAGTRTKFTISCWVKRGNLSGKPNDDPHRIIDAFKDANRDEYGREVTNESIVRNWKKFLYS